MDYSLISSILSNLTIPAEFTQIIKNHFRNSNILPESTEIIFVVMYLIVGFLGITVNVIVIIVILSAKKLRNLEYSLILNLCIADVLLCVWCIPFTLYQILRRDWSLGQILCQTVPFLQATIIFVIAQTIAVIAFERLSMITGKFTKRSKSWPSSSSNGCSVFKKIPLIWLSSVMLGSPLIYFYKEVNFNFNGIHLYKRCVEDWSAEIRIIYSSLTFLMSLVIPIVCLITSQIKIVFFLSRQGHLDSRIKCVSKMATSSPSTGISISATSNNNNSNGNNKSKANNNKDSASDENNNNVHVKSNNYSSLVNLTGSKIKSGITLHQPSRLTFAKGNRNRRAIISLYRVSITFILSWLPLNVVNLYLDLMEQSPLSGTKIYIILGICHLIAISSSVTNAVFYGLMNTNIKRELIKFKFRFTAKTNLTSTSMPSHVL